KRAGWGTYRPLAKRDLDKTHLAPCYARSPPSGEGFTSLIQASRSRWSIVLFPAPVLDFADQRGDLLHSRLDHFARRILRHAAAWFGIARRRCKGRVVVERHQVRAPDMLGGQQIGEPTELMVAGAEGNSLGGQHCLEQFLRRLL